MKRLTLANSTIEEMDALNPIFGKCRQCGVEFLRKRAMCGSLIQPSRAKLCDTCRPIKMAETARAACASRDYDKSRKHFTRSCKSCGKEFSVVGLNNSGKAATCSPECLSSLLSAHAKKMNPYLQSMISDRGEHKIFEKPRTTPGISMGPDHWKSAEFVLRSPCGEKHEGKNLKHFIRENESLFDAETVQWFPAKAYSKVKRLGYRPSRATGKMTCKAYRGLGPVLGGARKTWRGWSLESRGPKVFRKISEKSS